MQGLKGWSYSTLMEYEKCPYRVYLRRIKRVPEPPKEPDSPMDRGNRVHSGLEACVQGAGPLPDEAKYFAEKVDTLISLYDLGLVTIEQNWTFTSEWVVSDKQYDWLVMKLDACVITQDQGIVIDYKTGKSWPKKVEHVNQCQLYALGVALRNPVLTTITTEMWYLDEVDIMSMTFTREQALGFLQGFDARAQQLMHEEMWRPRPNVMNCKYCPYGRNIGNGACPVGV